MRMGSSRVSLTLLLMSLPPSPLPDCAAERLYAQVRYIDTGASLREYLCPEDLELSDGALSAMQRLAEAKGPTGGEEEEEEMKQEGHRRGHRTMSTGGPRRRRRALEGRARRRSIG